MEVVDDKEELAEEKEDGCYSRMMNVLCCRKKVEKVAVEDPFKKVQLKNPTASNLYEDDEDNHPRNALDGNKETIFSLKGDAKDGYWKAEFIISKSPVTRVEIMSGNQKEDELNNA